MIDVARARAETPGVENVLHFNNAGASLSPQPVVDAVIGHLRLEAAIGGYEAYDRRREAIERPYDALAQLLNCSREEIAIVENATRAWDMAFYALPLAAGDRILTAEAEYSSNYIAFLHVARRVGAIVDAIPSDEYGQVDTRALARAIDGRVKLIAITHVPTSGGLVNPAAEIGRIAKRAGIPFLLDACQSAGQIPLDVEAIGCDVLSGTGRKFLRGPRGTGFLYVRRSLLARLDPPFLDDHAAAWVEDDRYEVREDARKFETWEGYVAGKIGLGVAVDYALQWSLPAIRERVGALADGLRAQIAGLSDGRVHDRGRERCGIVTFTLPGIAAEAVKQQLARQAINVTVSVKEATRLDMGPRGLDRIVRASLHYYNTEAEIEKFVRALDEIMRMAARS